MGVERAVTRWYARQQALRQEIATLEARLQQLQAAKQPPPADALAIETQLGEAQRRLLDLGPCPRPMMG